RSLEKFNRRQRLKDGGKGRTIAAMQKGGVDRVGTVLVSLQPVGRLMEFVGNEPVVRGIPKRVQNRQWGRILGRPHVGKYQTGIFLGPVSAVPQRLLAAAPRRFAGR